MIIGHQKIRERLSRSVAKNACVQAYIFVGPESVGKFEVAKEFALRLIGGNDSASSQDYRKETDLFILEPEREVEKGVVKERDISVEQTREMSWWLRQFPYASDKKVLIIRDAHRLTESAQNALLKILEEPPVYAVIILVTHELGKMLPTTLSRCQQITFQLVAPKEIAEGIVQNPLFGTLLSKNKFLLKLGRPGLVVQSLKHDEEFLAQAALLEKLIHLSDTSLRERLVVSESCVANVFQTMQLLMWWVGGLHTRMLTVSSDESAMLMMSIEKIEKLRSDLKKFPSSARLLFDTFFIHW